MSSKPAAYENNKRSQHSSSANAATPHNKHNINRPNGCFELIFYGTCSKGERRSYSHTPHMLMATQAHFCALLASSKHKPTLTGSVSILGKTTTTPSLSNVSSHVVSHASYVEDEESSTVPVLAALMQDMLLAAMPESRIFSAVHRQGAIEAHDKLLI